MESRLIALINQLSAGGLGERVLGVQLEGGVGRTYNLLLFFCHAIVPVHARSPPSPSSLEVDGHELRLGDRAVVLDACGGSGRPPDLPFAGSRKDPSLCQPSQAGRRRGRRQPSYSPGLYRGRKGTGNLLRTAARRWVRLD